MPMNYCLLFLFFIIIYRIFYVLLYRDIQFTDEKTKIDKINKKKMYKKKTKTK